jgi:hypothetical protein
VETLEISKELKACIEALAEAEGLSVEEYLKRALKLVRFVQKEWAPQEENRP